jgi:glutaredoxin 3
MVAARRIKGFESPENEGESMAAKVEIYTKMWCGYCHRAKRLLESKGVEYAEYDITMGGEKRAEMRARKPDAHTVPQIFIDGQPIGGSDDLAALEREGKLDTLLGL